MTTLEGLSALASSGVMLALPHVTAMQSSLPILKKNYKFSKVFFWGKLQGRKSDYLIAMGVEDSYNTKKFFFWCAYRLPALLPASSNIWHETTSDKCNPCPRD